MPYENDYPEPDSPPASEAPSEPSGDKEEDTGEATALLPKSVLGGKEFQPGEEVVLKIVHIYEDEVEVAYASEKSEESEESKIWDKPMMSEAMSKMDEMAV